MPVAVGFDQSCYSHHEVSDHRLLCQLDYKGLPDPELLQQSGQEPKT